jgi:hypothetical protein
VRGASALVIVATITSLAIVTGLVLLLVFSGEIARSRIVEEARKRGVELSYEDASFWWTSASLEDVRFRLVGVPGLEGQVGALDVTLSSWEPGRIVAGDVRLAVVGSAADLMVTLASWTRRHPGAYQLPVAADAVALEWRAAPGEAPWLTVADGGFAEGASKVVFTAKSARVSGVDLGAVTAAWQVQSSTISLAFGAEDRASAPIALVVETAARPPTARLTLAPTDLEKLSAPLGVVLPVKGVTASGQVDLVLPEGLTPAPIQGHLEATLEGWVPPHPVELGGFVFGTRTTFGTDLAVAADASSVTLTRSKVQAGAFVLTGGGKVAREPGHAVIEMDLSGSLGCAAIAHVGSFLGSVIGSTARRVVEGSVAVRVRVAADTRDLDAARVDRVIGVGCGLAPLKSLDPRLRKLIPPEVLEMAEALPGALPPLDPKKAPALPSLSDLQKRLQDAKVPSLPSAFALPLPLPKPAASSGEQR